LGLPLPFAFGLAFGPLEATAKSISAAKLLRKTRGRVAAIKSPGPAERRIHVQVAGVRYV
jgi:hypothetical protein